MVKKKNYESNNAGEKVKISRIKSAKDIYILLKQTQFKNKLLQSLDTRQVLFSPI